MTTEESRLTSENALRVVVVGPCASGKTTLVENLKRIGIDARVSGQEHSAIRNLWRRLEPDVLIALDLDLDTLRERRNPTWPADLYSVQHVRLAGAFEAATVVINTSDTPEEDVFEQVLAIIDRYRTNSA